MGGEVLSDTPLMNQTVGLISGAENRFTRQRSKSFSGGFGKGVGSEYGSVSGRFKCWIYRAGLRLGFMCRWTAVEWQLVRRLVFVWKGNACLGSYAELRAKMLGFPSISCGLQANPGGAAGPEAVKTAVERGIDLQGRLLRHFNETRFEPGDLAVCMEPVLAGELSGILDLSNVQVTILGLWSGPLRPYLEDPYGLTPEYHHRCFSLIDSAVERVILNIENERYT